MKTILTKTTLISIVSFLFLLSSCSPDEGLSKPSLGLTEVNVVTEATATCTSSITSDGGTNIKACGVCWDTVPYPTLNGNKTSDTYGKEFSSTLTNLSPNTTYYVRAYATNKMGTMYGLQATLITKSFALVTNAPIAVMAQSAQCGGLFISNGDSLTVTERGICWSTSLHPTVELVTKAFVLTRVDSFWCTLTNLLPNTTYYARVFATNSVGTTYGNEVNFKTQHGIPTITTTPASSLTITSAKLRGNITGDGGSSVTERGFCWSKESNPTISLPTKTAIGSGVGSFSGTLTNLEVNTTYHVRTYATNGVGTTYGNEIEFTTRNGVVTLTTTDVSSKTTYATLAANITDDGGAPITEHGVCWSTSPNPTISLSTKVAVGSGVGYFSKTLTGLQASTTFYVRVYATNSVGTTYGVEKTFTTRDLTGTLTDIDGNVYHYVTIGNKSWMVENLKTTKYRDGTSIPNITDPTQWRTTNSGAYCNYANTASNSDTYGRLYNWYAVKNLSNIAPEGWHVPTQEEWVELTNYLGGEVQAGDKLKEVGTAHWLSPNSNSTNESGFTALPGGRRLGDTGEFDLFGYDCLWWTTSNYSSSEARGRSLQYTLTTVVEKYNSGLSVRCIRD